MPAAGGQLYVRLWSNVGTSTAPVWTYVDYTYILPKSATMASPAPGSKLTGSATFTWNAAGGASAYQLYVGTSQGAADIAWFAPTTGLSQAVSNIPSGRTIYVRLWTQMGTTWTYNDYIYTS